MEEIQALPINPTWGNQAKTDIQEVFPTASMEEGSEFDFYIPIINSWNKF